LATDTHSILLLVFFKSTSHALYSFSVTTILSTASTLLAARSSATKTRLALGMWLQRKKHVSLIYALTLFHTSMPLLSFHPKNKSPKK
jgi:hypothetical protein